jgi:putative PIN family toxin of toxin-antitoxin system
VGWQQGVFVPLASTATAQELVRVLAYPKFRLSKLEQDELLADYLPHTETVRIPQPPPSVPDCRDLLDVPFMHLAVAGKAEVLVSGDRDLLALADEFKKTCACPIVSLDTFFRAHLAG